MVQCINHISDVKYDAKVYSRHGGCHSKWWYQERSLWHGYNNPIQCDFNSQGIYENGTLIAVYIKHSTKYLEEIGKSLLEYIGGQNHIICGKHKLPLIPVPDRKAKCKCGKKESLRCPDLSCLNCICDTCAEKLDTDIINEIDINDEVSISTNEDNHSCSSSKITPYDMNNSASEISEDDKTDTDKLEVNDEECYIFDDDDDYSSIDTADFNIASNEKNIDRDDLDMYLTHQIPECEEHEFGNDIEETVEDEFYIPTTDAGDQPFQIEKNDDMQQTRGVNISGHVMLNFVGTVLTRERHLLKPSSIHKYFLQRIVATSIGKSVSL